MDDRTTLEVVYFLERAHQYTVERSWAHRDRFGGKTRFVRGSLEVSRGLGEPETNGKESSCSSACQDRGSWRTALLGPPVKAWTKQSGCSSEDV